jgi:hypothetical protein
MSFSLLDPTLDAILAGFALCAIATWHQIDHNAESAAAMTIAAGTFFVIMCRFAYSQLPHRRLRLVIDNSDECLPKSNKVWANGVAADHCFVRIKLCNTYMLSARDTAVFLMSIHECNAGGYRRLDYSNPQFLRWNGDSGSKPYLKKTIPHGGPQYVDLLFTEQQSSQVKVVLTDQPYTSVGLTTDKTYRFVVQATADDAKSATVSFYVKIGRAYDAILIYQCPWIENAKAVWRRHFAARAITAVNHTDDST